MTIYTYIYIFQDVLLSSKLRSPIKQNSFIDDLPINY